jgi:hypothetical protein
MCVAGQTGLFHDAEGGANNVAQRVLNEQFVIQAHFLVIIMH